MTDYSALPPDSDTDGSKADEPEIMSTLLEVLMMQKCGKDTEVERLRVLAERAAANRRSSLDQSPDREFDLAAGVPPRWSGKPSCYFFTRGTLTLADNCCKIAAQTKHGGSICTQGTGYGCYPD